MKSLEPESGGHPEQIWDRLNEQILRLYEQGQYDEAIPIAMQARELARQERGTEHPDYANSLGNLADLYQEAGNYAAAEPLYHQALAIRRKALGGEHPEDVATSLNDLAMLYKAMGNYAAAEPRYHQAVAIFRKALGEEDPYVAISLNNLAALYQAMGNYAAAEPLYRQALAIQRKVSGEEHPEDVANILNNLAVLYQTMANYAAAEPLYHQALAIRRKALGEEHPDVAISLNNLAELYREVGNYAAAETRYRQALEIFRKALGEEHPHIASILDNLAGLYCDRGNYAAAEPLYHQALAIRRKALGEEHPDVAISLNSLAMLYKAMGNYAAAEPRYRQALEIFRKALGEEHPHIASILDNLANLAVALGRQAEALPLMQEASAIHNRMLGQVFSIGSESQRMAYVTARQGSLNAFLSLAVRYLLDSPGVLPAALELVLRRKALGAEVLAAQRDTVLSGRYPALEATLRELYALRAQIARKTLAGPNVPGPEALHTHQQLLTDWNDQKERLEAELARQIPEMNLEQQLHAASRQAVAGRLPTGAVLVEFVRFDVFDFQAVLARGQPSWKPARYLAFVLIAGEPENMHMIDLDEAEPIDGMIAAFRAAATGGERALTIEAQPTSSDTGDGTDLRAAVFDPLLPALGGRTQLFLAPDGDLSQLPFEVLPLEDDRRLIDDYQISYLSTGRDILRFTVAVSGSPQSPFIIADPDFNLDAEGTETLVDEQRPISHQSRDLDRSSLHFSRLKGAQQEGEQVGALLGVLPLLAQEALEGRLKGSRSPRILHLATHGFFVPDQPRNPNTEHPTMSLGSSEMSSRLFGQHLENPLLRSGLALAGANSWLQGKPLLPEAEDGLLTAEDVTGLDLLDTELVVLSACDTGRGEVHVGEGVFGLRRAFVLAGAKTLVMSLWKVPDQATRELMVDFYQRLLKGTPRAQALREAQRALKAKPEYSHHRFWGAFICQGDPGPLFKVGLSHDIMNEENRKQ